MAEVYSTGVVRLWYRSAGFRTGLDVRGDFRGPGSIRHSNLEFVEEGDGLYYLDYDFSVIGSYVVIISEDGERKTSQNFNIEKPSSRRWIPGDNLLNL